MEYVRLENMKRQMVIVSSFLFIIFNTVIARSCLLPGLSYLTSEDSEVKQEINNSLDYVMKNNQDYLSNPMLVSLWVMSKAFLGYSDNKTEVINYFNSRQESDGAWNGSWTKIFTTHRVLYAYYLLNARPARNLDTFLSDYDTWDEVKTYMLEHGDARNAYHVIFAWILYYWAYPVWLDEFFNQVEADLSWTNSSDFHERTHILYSYVVARRQFPNLDGIIDATISAQTTDGKWDGSGYSFYSSHGDVYFVAIQISLLAQILKLYPNYRTYEIKASLEKAKLWLSNNYYTQALEGKTCGYFGNLTSMEISIFCGILGAGQTGLLSANVDMSFQSVVDNIVPEFSHISLMLILLFIFAFALVFVHRSRSISTPVK